MDIMDNIFKCQDEKINCLFSKQIHLANIATFSEEEKKMHCNASACSYSSNHYSRRDKLERHMVNCAWQPGTICDFNILNLVTFQDNIKYKGDIPLLALIDFETNSPADSYLDAEQKKCLQCLMW